jgi:hypothetical protein
LGRLESVSARAIRRACVDHQVVAGEAQLRRIRTTLAAPVLISIYGELIAVPCLLSRRFSSPPVFACLTSRRNSARIGSNVRLLPTEEELALFRDAAAEPFTRRFYSPPVWKVNAAVMFWKASKRERCESDDEHFGVGPYRAV